MTSPRQQQVWRNVPSPSHAGSIALLNSSNRLMTDSLSRISGAFTEFGDRYQEKQNNLFLDQISKSESPEAIQALLNAVPANTNIGAKELNSFVNDHNDTLRSNEKRLNQSTVDDNFLNPEYKFTPRQKSMFSTSQRNNRDEAITKQFMTGVEAPAMGESAVARNQNLNAFRTSEGFSALNPAQQKLAIAGWHRNQNTDAGTIGSASSAQDYDTNQAEKRLTRGNTALTRNEAQQKRNLTSRLDDQNNIYTDSEYSQLSSSGQKSYDQKHAAPVIKQFTDLGDDVESRVRNFLSMTQQQEFQSLSIPQQELVVKQVQKRNGLTDKTIGDTMMFMSDGSPVDDRSTFQKRPKWMGGTPDPTLQPQQQQLSPQEQKLVGMLQDPAALERFLQSPQYKNNSEYYDSLFGGE